MADEQDYEKLRAKLLSTGSLYEDPDFQATARSLKNSGIASSRIRWKRPKEITSKAKFVVTGETRFDLHQGELGDCWFIAATATLAVSNGKLMERVVPPDQSFSTNYAGIFRFNVWRFGRWQEVTIDDRLPTLDGKLMFAHNRKQKHEFWVPLFEKAYAKLNGSYENIDGGIISNALVDFTGGISESINLRKTSELPENFYDVMCRMLKMNSMMGCSIDTKTVNRMESTMGLYAGHAYSITNIVQVHVDNKPVPLLRLRNPWGKREWLGDWKDRSYKWNDVSQAEKDAIGFKKWYEGEFWISFDDWLAKFDVLTICHLYPDATTEEIARDTDKQPWNVTSHHGSWKKGANAGGCGNDPYTEMFWTNPQYRLTLTEADDDNDDGLCTVIISLMQKTNKLQLPMGFEVYHATSSTGRMTKSETSAVHMNVILNSRELTAQLKLKPGSYIIIPYTFYPNLEGEFLLRLYTEKNAESSVNDEVVTLVEPVVPQKPKEPPKKKPKLDDSIKDLFKMFAGQDLKMDAEESKQALNAVLGKEVEGFSPETARSILCLLDTNKSGCIEYEEFSKMIESLNLGMKVFKSHDKDNSKTIDSTELRDVFKQIGLTLSEQVMTAVMRRYSANGDSLSLEHFVHVLTRLFVMLQLFIKASADGLKGTANFKLDDWLAITMNY